MRKTLGPDGTARVEFTLDPAVGAATAAVCGEWNGWQAGVDLMERRADGGFALTVTLTAGRAYRFRYLLDGHRWENDWQADVYVPNDFGAEDSVVDLTGLVERHTPAGGTEAPSDRTAAKKAPAKKASPTKKAPAKKAAPTKKAADDAAGRP